MVSPVDETEAGDGGAVGLYELKPPDNLKNGVVRWCEADIKFILPAHLGLKLLLEQVESHPNSSVIGRLRVIPERCVGFCSFKGEELALTGADLIEMAAQLLGVWGYHYKEIFAQRHRQFVLGSLKGAEFHKLVRAGETVCVEIAKDDIRVRESLKLNQFVIRAEKCLVKVDHEVRGIIYGITLMSASEKARK